MSRVLEIQAAVDGVTSEHEAWSNADEPYLTEPFSSAVEDAILIINHGDVPHSCRELVKAFDMLEREWLAYKDQAEASPSPILPENGFWAALAEVQRLRAGVEEQPIVPLESIADLVEQKVPPGQIAKIYGWVDGNGNPEVWKVAEERAKPGTWTGENFVDPRVKKRQQEAIAKAEAAKRVQLAAARKVAKLTTPAPETWEQLFGQGLSARQIARMKKVTLEEVMDKAKELGYPLPDLDYRAVQTARAPQEPDLTEDEERSIDAGVTAGAKEAPKRRGRSRKAPVPIIEDEGDAEDISELQPISAEDDEQ